MSIETKIDELINNGQYEEARIELIKNKMYIDELYYYANLGYVECYFHHFDEAFMYYQKFLEIEDHDAWIYSQLGYIMNLQNKPVEALKFLNKSKELGRDDIFILGEFGLSYELMGDFKTALNYYEDALMEDDSNTWLYTKAAACYARLADFDEAISYLTKAKALGEHHGLLYFELAYAYLNKEMWEEAYKNFMIIEKEFEDEMDAYDYFNYAKSCFYGSDENEKALTLLQIASDMGLDHSGVHELFGDIYDYLGNQKKAYEHIEISLKYCLKRYEKDVEDVALMAHIASLYKNIKKYEEACSFYQKMKDMGEDNYYVNYQIGHTLTHIKQFEQSNEYLNKALEFDESTDVYSYLGFNYTQLKQWEKVKTSLLKCMSLGRDDVWLYRTLGQAYAKTGYYHKNNEDNELALKYLRIAKTKEADISIVDSLIGWVLYNMGKYKECIEVLEEAVKELNDDGFVHVNLATSYTRVKQYKKAMYHFRLANIRGGFDWDDDCSSLYEKCKKEIIK